MPSVKLLSCHAEGAPVGWLILAVLWVQSVGASSPEGFTSNGFPEGEDVTLPLFKLQWAR